MAYKGARNNMMYFKMLLKNKSFRALWLSQFLSQVAIHTLNFLVILKIYQATGSSIATSLVWLVFIIPAILLGPIAAAFVDMVDKRKILMVANAAQGLIILVYALVHMRVLYLSYGVVLLYSIFNQFYIPAEIASLPSLVKEKYLPQANGFFLATYQIGLVIGFGLSGLVGELLGFTAAFLIAAGFLGMAFLSVYQLPRLSGGITRAWSVSSWKGRINNFIVEIIEGLKFIGRSKDIYLPFIAISGLQVSLAVSLVLLPEIARNVLDLNPSYAGLVVVAPCGIGGALGIIIVTKLLSERFRKKSLAKWALRTITVELWMMVLFVKLIPLPFRLVVSGVMFMLIGASFIGIFIPAQTHLQISTPKKMMARVFGNSWFLTTALTVFPMMFSATIAEVMGPRVLFSMVGIGLVGVLAFYDKYV